MASVLLIVLGALAAFWAGSMKSGWKWLLLAVSIFLPFWAVQIATNWSFVILR